MLLNCVLVYWCCAILVRGFRCVKQHDSVVWKTHTVRCETTSATRGRTMEHGGYYQLR
jgi:hypothetical protein